MSTLPRAYSALQNVVDLTGLNSSDDDDDQHAAAQSIQSPRKPTMNNPPRERLSEKRTLSNVRRTVSPQSVKRTPPANTSNPRLTIASALEDTPSKYRRSSLLSSLHGDDREPSMSRPSEDVTVASPHRLATPPPPSYPAEEQPIQTPSNPTPKGIEWTPSRLEASLRLLSRDVQRNHARLLHFTFKSIASQRTRQRRHLGAVDDFGDLKASVAEKDSKEETMKVKLKQHGREHQRGKQEQRQLNFRVICIKTTKAPPPRYRFHHVEISKNILSPNTPLKFIPHLKDLQDGSGDTEKFNQWIEELDSMDQKSGFDTTRRLDKAAKTRTAECARVLSLYLERWIKRLGIGSCSKSSLIRFMASQSENDDAITPQQKSSLLSSYNQDVGSPKAVKMARLFTDAFDSVFHKRKVTLKDVLMLDEWVETVVDNKKLSKDTLTGQKPSEEPLTEQVQQWLGTYTALGCLICYSHSCEHGDYDGDNNRRCLSIDSDFRGKLTRLVTQRRIQQEREAPSRTCMAQPCKNKCFRSYDVGNDSYVTKPWTDGEINILRSMFVILGNSTVRPQCTVAIILGRFCWEVYRQMKNMNLTLPEIQVPTDTPTIKNLNWYDRHKKALNGDWQDHTYTHEHSMRELRDPCFHDGPCSAARGCPCVEAKVLCERFCRCTAETCAYKFQGCACHGSGKTCYARQKEGRPCICVQLNRECDPVLCGGCGARERADRENAHDELLHSTGCQNVALQRGLAKTVLLGKSQLEGCGYGLVTAEDIAADEFVIEYLGELITHDEGVRREARRGDVFDQESNSSYLFTLLEQDGIWVDAAIYGNLSRYVNHASEHDKRGCNIVPKILYVNGEFRIKFSSMRDIKAGEELFFNYGENFPNLTKKLLEDKADVTDGDTSALPAGEKKKKRRGGRPPRNPNAKPTAGKRGANTSKQNGARKEAPPAREESPDDPFTGDPFAIDDPLPFPKPKRGRKRKHFEDEDEDAQDEWRPGAKDSGDEEFVFRGRQRRRGGGPSRRAPPRREIDDSEGEKPVPRTPVRRGRGGRGSRGGRRKKVQPPPRATSTAAAEDNADSGDEPLMKHGSGRRTSRKVVMDTQEASTLDGDGDTAMSGLSAQNFYGDGDGDGAADWDPDDDDDGANDSTKRKRQKPARFRDEEA